MSAVATTPGRSYTVYDAPAGNNWSVLKLALIGLLVGVGFWFIDHDFISSDRYLFADEIFEVENYTADAIERAGVLSAPSRIFLGMIGVVLFLLPSRQQLQIINPISVMLFMVIGFFLVSITWSSHPRVSLQKCVSLTLLILTAVGVAKQFSLRELIRLLPIICIGYIFFGGLVEVGLGNFRPWLGQYRFVGTTHPNTQAVYASLCCLAAASFRRKAGDSMYWPLLLASIGIATLLLTKSRTTMLALLVAISSLGYLQLRGIQRAFVISMILTGLSLFGIVLCLQSTTTIDSLRDSLALGRTEHITNLTGRLPLWEELSRFIVQRPVLGYGYLGFWDSARVQYLSDTLGWEIPHGHNMYIDLMLDGGILGLFIFVGFLIACLLTSIERYKNYGDAAMAAVFSFVIFAIVHGSAESLFKVPNFLMFVLITLVVRLGFTPRETSQTHKRLVVDSQLSLNPRPLTGAGDVTL